MISLLQHRKFVFKTDMNRKHTHTHVQKENFKLNTKYKIEVILHIKENLKICNNHPARTASYQNLPPPIHILMESDHINSKMCRAYFG